VDPKVHDAANFVTAAIMQRAPLTDAHRVVLLARAEP